MKEQAEFYRRGLLLGSINPADAITWCDSIITAEESPDIGIIEASISASQCVYAIASALTPVEGEFDPRAVTKRIFRSMYDLVRQDRKQAPKVARLLYRMVSDNPTSYGEAEGEMWYFYDAVDLAVEGYYGDEEKLINEMLHFLETRSAPSA